MKFLEPSKSWSPRKGQYQKVHPKAGRDFSLLSPTYLLLVELNWKAGSRGANIMHFVDMHRVAKGGGGQGIKRIMHTSPTHKNSPVASDYIALFYFFIALIIT